MSNLDFMGRIAEGKIQEAMEEGKFDDLPGRGKPIVFDEDPLTPPHLRLANRILRNANVLPEWMQIQKDIEHEARQIGEMHSRLARENQRWAVRISRSQTTAGAARQYAQWHAQSRAAYLRLVKSANTSILKFTLVAPSTARPIPSHKVDELMDAFDSEVPCHVQSDPPEEREAPRDNSLHQIARSRAMP
jgi:DnaJ homolog subfamily C member 28